MSEQHDAHVMKAALFFATATAFDGPYQSELVTALGWVIIVEMSQRDGEDVATGHVVGRHEPFLFRQLSGLTPVGEPEP